MRKLLPFGFLVVFILLFFKQVFIGGYLPIPSDTIVGLYHPYRDLLAKEYPRGIPFKNFLITDPVRQLYPWRQLVINAEKKLQVPLWNPYNFSGTPLLANFQSAAFYPLNLFLFLLPLQYGWSLLIILQPLLGGIFMYLYLRNLKLRIAPSLLGSLVFAFSGFSIAWLEWNTVSQVMIWVPLILLAKDTLLKKWTIKWAFIFLFAECAAMFAGHVQVLFYAFCVTNLYLFIRIYQKAKRQRQKNFFTSYSRIYLPFLIVGILVYSLTAIQWVPTLQFISLSARSLDQSMWQQPGWFIPWQNLFQFVAPDFFGNPATLNYFGLWNYAEFVGYIGIVPLLFSLLAITFRRDKKTYFYSFLLLAALLFALPTPLAKLPFILHVPFLETSQPTRLLALIDFSLAILSGLGFDYLLKRKKGILVPIGIVAIALLIAFAGLKLHAFAFSEEQTAIAFHNLVPPLILFMCSLFVIGTLFIEKKRLQYISMIVLFLLVAFDLFRFGQKFTPFTNQAYLFPQTKTISYLQKNLGEYRIMTTDSRIFPPNFSSMYKIQSVDGYDPLYLQNYAEIIAASERGKPNIDPPFGFNRIITPHNIMSPFINVLGVKYVLSLTDIHNPQFRKVFQEGETQVYENTKVLPRAIIVSSIVNVKTSQEVIEKMFSQTFDPTKQAVLKTGASFVEPKGKGTATITQYNENKVKILTDVNKDSFLLLTDVYYPTWKATVDERPTTIFETDFAFRGVFIPAGKHTVVFSDGFFNQP